MRMRKEDAADKWLKTHDPYYLSKKKDKRRKESYPYLTASQELEISRREIPLSNLSKSQRNKIKDTLGAYTEDGDYNL